jgi:hypothetical protein
VTVESPRIFTVGDLLTRIQILAGRGGNFQAGIVVSRATSEVLVFSDPKAGRKSGYDWDGWVDADQNVFYYTGEGSKGDQEFTRGNKALRDSAAEGLTIHVFLAAGKVAGSQATLQRYVGEFNIDADTGWRREEGIDGDGEARSAIVFELTRVGSAVPADPEVAEHDAADVSAATTAEAVAPEADEIRSFQQGPTEARSATRRERELENKLAKLLRSQKVEPQRLKITIAGQAASLYTDTWDRTNQELYEAKGSVTRANVRTAIGQLLDYRRHIKPAPTKCTVLLPTDPGPDLTDLVLSAGMDLLFDDGNRFIRRSATARP